jgi:hypothetical protein
MTPVRFTSQTIMRFVLVALCALSVGAGDAAAQTIDVQRWEGANAATRQPEQVVAGTQAEWRSLWSRVGVKAPDMFEPGRMEAVGIFLGGRATSGYAVNILSAARRRDRIIVVFEERAPSNVLTAQGAPTARALSTVPTGTAGFASGAPVASVPAIPYRPAGPPTSPWAILLINRADLPVIVEQRLFVH